MLLITRVFVAALTAILLTTLVQADSLSDIYQSALQNDPVLRAARATYMAKKETVQQGRAVLLPQLSASTTYRETDNKDASTGANSETTNYSLNLSQALFNMPAWFQFQSAKQMDQSAQADFSAHQQALIIRVSEAYFNVLRTHNNMQTRKAEERAIQRQLEQTRERFKVGLLPITDVYETQAIFDETAVNSLEARGALDIAFAQLQVLSGRSHHVLAGLKDEFAAIDPKPLDASAWVDFALANNLQLKSSQLAKQASRSTAKAAKYKRLPQVTVSANYSKNDSDTLQDNGSSHPPEQSSISLNLTMPIHSGGLISSQHRQAAYQATAAEENFIASKRNTMQSARSTHQLVITNAARVKARKQAITSADSALKATQAGYEVGTRNVVDVLVGQRTLYQAKRNYANARYDYILSMMRLKEIAGQLSPKDIVELDKWLERNIAIKR